jgi:molybdopterin synthase sulfur carrier subunit
MGQVQLYATLRPRADGERRIDIAWGAQSRVGDVIRELLAMKPGLQGYILGDDGAVVPYVSVFLDGRDIRYLDGLDTVLDGHTELAIFPPVAGGCSGGSSGC